MRAELLPLGQPIDGEGEFAYTSGAEKSFGQGEGVGLDGRQHQRRLEHCLLTGGSRHD